MLGLLLRCAHNTGQGSSQYGSMYAKGSAVDWVKAPLLGRMRLQKDPLPMYRVQVSTTQEARHAVASHVAPPWRGTRPNRRLQILSLEVVRHAAVHLIELTTSIS